ncbi:MAG: type II toxin-antitoxin system HicB family antitoxin [Candidatus Cloacimonetes bacterium]|nr:type II toxin-antitoxin system HicB family antitoxin [Candidatus Cloacimonadota bacterium]
MEKIVGSFRVIIEPDERVGTNEPCYSAHCPTLGIADDGDTIEEALASIKEGIKCYQVAIHPKPVAKGTLRTILRETEVSVGELKKLL